jgi:DNA-binding PadR family transcriptional regulator
MTGYIMKKRVTESLAHFWKTSYGQIYPTMNKFVEDDLVTVEIVANEKGPTSKLYTITEKGILELMEWLIIDVDDFNAKDETQLKFYFSGLLPIDDVIKKAERSLAYNQRILDNYNNTSTKMEETKRPTRNQLNTYLAVRKGIFLNEARVKWAQECINTLKWYQSLDENT